ncbi:hypothetical protein M3Y95_00399000 [Aphelenchoides besseyi]|nr:hypothetical protein M3Y95_00399000 [Aphelenchoides besseyi]
MAKSLTEWISGKMTRTRERPQSAPPILLLILFISSVNAHGMTTFQCPNGFYISKFNSAYDGSERFYQFGCSRFSSSLLSFDEECTTTESASTANGDMYLSCGSDQYTVGVEIIEDVETGVDSWQLLCCKSQSVRIRTGDCIDTKFINDHRRAASFSSAAQVIRRWQAMSENGDRRWWLQICPVDFELKKPQNIGEIRARRQVPYEWARGRFPVDVKTYNPFFLDQMKRDEEERKKMFENMVQNTNSAFPSSSSGARAADPSANIFSGLFIPPITPPQLPTLTPPLGVPQPSLFNDPAIRVDLPTTSTRSYRARTITYKNDRLSALSGGTSRLSHPNFGPTAPITTTTPTTTTEKQLEALDYYDLYDEHFDKKKHTEGGLLRGVSDLLQNLQDGLTLAQVAFPQRDGAHNFQLKLGLPGGSSTPKPNFMFSNDEDSLQIGSFVQQMDSPKKTGPFPKPPPRSTTTESPQPKVNAVESMLQMVGLCQGHV